VGRTVPLTAVGLSSVGATPSAIRLRRDPRATGCGGSAVEWVLDAPPGFASGGETFLGDRPVVEDTSFGVSRVPLPPALHAVARRLRYLAPRSRRQGWFESGSCTCAPRSD
jgi:hypothetical protein